MAAREAQVQGDDVGAVDQGLAKARELFSRSEWEEAATLLDELVRRFGDSASPEVEVRVTAALFGRAFAVSPNGKYDAALVVYDALIARLDDASRQPLRAQLADVMLEKSKVLLAQESFDETINTCDEITGRFSQDGVETRKRVVLALLNKAIALEQLGRVDDAIATRDELVRRFASDGLAPFSDKISQLQDEVRPDKLEELAGALAAKADLLVGLVREAEAIATFTELITIFEDDASPLIGEVVSRAQASRERLLENDEGCSRS